MVQSGGPCSRKTCGNSSLRLKCQRQTLDIHWSDFVVATTGLQSICDMISQQRSLCQGGGGFMLVSLYLVTYTLDWTENDDRNRHGRDYPSSDSDAAGPQLSSRSNIMQLFVYNNKFFHGSCCVARLFSFTGLCFHVCINTLIRNHIQNVMHDIEWSSKVLWAIGDDVMSGVSCV